MVEPYLAFDEAKHEYTLMPENRVLPSVTTVLKEQGLVDYSMIPQEILQAASKRGTAVHRAIEYFLDGDLDDESIDPRISGYVDAARRFLREAGVQVRRRECQVFHACGYAGTFDVDGLIGNDPTVIDWKTGIILPGHAIQLAAYANCLDRPRSFRRLAVKLNDDGTYRVHEFPKNETMRDVQIFMSALACMNWRQEKGLN